MIPLAQLTTIEQPDQSKDSQVDELMSGLQPLKPEVEVPLPPESFNYFFVILIIVILLIIGGLIYWFWNKQKPQKVLTPEQLAMNTLERLSKEDLSNDTFIMKVSHAFKRYLEDKKLFTAVSQTTEEFLQTLRNSDKMNDQSKTLKTFFEQCDFIKFAGGKLDEEQRLEYIEVASSLVKEIEQKESSKLNSTE